LLISLADPASLFDFWSPKKRIGGEINLLLFI
jgi:hypothetical protein